MQTALIVSCNCQLGNQHICCAPTSAMALQTDIRVLFKLFGKNRGPSYSLHSINHYVTNGSHMTIGNSVCGPSVL